MAKLYSQSTATTTIYYSGFVACNGGECYLCGQDYWCINTPGSWCGDTPPYDTKTFFDPVPAGNTVTSVTINYWTASCVGAAIYGTINSFSVPVAYDGASGCYCSENPCMLTTSVSSYYPCGLTGYVYGGYNTFTLYSSADLCINRAELVFTYYPTDVIIPSITPSNPTMCAGGSITLNAGAGYSAYYWNTGETSQTINVTTGGTYTVTVTGAAGCVTNSASTTVTEVADPSITSQPVGGTICTGGSITLNGAATGGTPSLTYQWYNSGGAISGATSPTYSATAAGNYYYIVSASGSGCTSATSNSATVTVVADPSITNQPVGGTICTGGSVTLSVTATGGTPSLTYQWYNSSGAISGATSSSYSATAADNYYCIVSASGSGCTSATSNSATVTVVADPSITSQPVGGTICAGGSVILSVTATGGTPSLTYQWYNSIGAISGATSSSYSATAADNYYCIVSASGSGCTSATSNSATVTVVADPSITSQPVGGTICMGGSITLSLTATGGTPSLTYQWYNSSGAISGATSSSYSATVAGDYYCIVSASGSGCTSATSNSATVTVVADPSITSQPVGGTICTGGAVTLSVTATGGTPSLTYQWYNSGGAISGATSSTYSTTAAGTYYCIVSASGSGCSSATSNSATVTVVADPSITSQPAGGTICTGGSITLSVTATGGTPSLTYQWYNSSGAISGATSSSYSATAAGTYYCIVSASGSGCGSVTSSTVTITLTPDNTLILSSAAGTNAQIVCNNSPINDITYATTGATGAVVSGLPSGVTGSWASNVVTIIGTPTVTGTYIYTVTTTGGCATAAATGTIVVNVSMIADISLQAFDNPACSHTLVNFTATAVNGGSAPAYQWYLNGNPVGTNSSTYSNISLTTGNTIYCQLTSNQTCVTNNIVLSNTITMVVSPIPIADGGPSTAYWGTPVQIGDPTNGPGTITWLPAAGLNNPSIGNPTASPTATTTYTITVNNNGCVRTDTVTVVYGGLGHIIAGKTRYLKKATAGYPAPNMPSYNAAKYDIDNVEVKLKTSPGGVVLATTMSNASGFYQFTNVADGNYMLSYDHIPYDTMQYVNHVTAVDLALLQYYIGHICQTDPSRCFSDKHMRAANVDNNASITAVDVSRISAKIGLPYTPARNFPKGNWVALDTLVTVAGADLNVTLQTIAYGDYDASSTKYKDSASTWDLAKSLPDENIILRSDELIILNNPEYFEVPLRISIKMNELSALGLELSYPSDKYKLVSATMPKTSFKNSSVKINPTLDEIISQNNDLLVTDDQGIIRVVFATTDYFDIAANEELIRVGFRSINDPDQGELDFNLNGTGLMANQYGEINEDAFLLMPKIFVQGNNTEAGFEFAGYPNPFSSDATLTYNIPENGTIKINVYNAIGELVSELINETQISGKHSMVFSPLNLPIGMYTFKLEFTGSDKSKCMVLKMIH